MEILETNLYLTHIPYHLTGYSSTILSIEISVNLVKQVEWRWVTFLNSEYQC